MPIIAAAAMATPSCEPMPPSTTMARIVADSMKVKLSGLTKPLAHGEERAGEAAEHRAERERRELGVGGVDAERAASDLVLAKRLPGPADREPAQPNGHEIGQEREREDQIEKKDRAVDRRIGQVEDRCEPVVVVSKRYAEERHVWNC